MAPVMVDNSSAAPFEERPAAISLSRHIWKNRFTSTATSRGKSKEAAPSTVHGHIRSAEWSVPRNARVHTLTGSGSFANSCSMSSATSSV
jgi:hypothetical protein